MLSFPAIGTLDISMFILERLSGFVDISVEFQVLYEMRAQLEIAY